MRVMHLNPSLRTTQIRRYTCHARQRRPRTMNSLSTALSARTLLLPPNHNPIPASLHLTSIMNTRPLHPRYPTNPHCTKGHSTRFSAPAAMFISPVSIRANMRTFISPWTCLRKCDRRSGVTEPQPRQGRHPWYRNLGEEEGGHLVVEEGGMLTWVQKGRQS